MFEYLQSMFEQVSPFVAYLMLTASAFAENVVPPIPGDTVVVLGAYLVSIGELDFWGVYISTVIGSVGGFIMMYYIGRRFGRSFIFKKSRAKIFKPQYIKKVELWFSKWGYGVIFANRFLSGTRSVVSLFSGMFHLNAFLVVILSMLSAAIWNGLLISAGMLLGQNWEVISKIIGEYNRVLIILTAALAAFLIYRRYSKKKQEI
jgi:membrane protein DedA with SNARE-associated domain